MTISNLIAKRSPILSAQESAIQEGVTDWQGRRDRVCLVTAEFNGLFKNGGIGTANTGLALALAEAGFQVTVAFVGVNSGKQSSSDNSIPELQGKYLRLGVKLDYVPNDPLVPQAFEDSRKVSYCVYLYLKRHSFDVVYFNDCGGQGYYTQLAKHTGALSPAPQIYVVAHGPQEWVHDLNSIAWERSSVATAFLERRSVELADMLISPSHYLREWMADHGWTMPPKVRIVPNIVPLPATSLPVSSLGLEPGALKEIVFFGRLETRKGVELFCDAIDQLHQYLDLSCIRITFLGKFGKVGDLHSGIYIAERTRRWRFSFRLLAKYGQEEALAYLRRPGIVAVIPSYAENSPCVVAECLHLGIPFLATETGGTGELVAPEDRESCLVPPEAGKLAERLEKIFRFGYRMAHVAVDAMHIREEWLEMTKFGLGHEQRSRTLPDTRLQETSEYFSEQAALVSVCLAGLQLCSSPNSIFQAVLNQSYRRFEVILIRQPGDADELSWPDLRVGEDCIPVEVVRGTFADIAAARNAAAAKARGDLLFFIDEGSAIPDTECLAYLVQAQQKTGAVAVSAMASRPCPRQNGKDGLEAIIDSFPVGACAELGGVENCFGGGVLLIDRNAFSERGGFPAHCNPEIHEWIFLAGCTLAGMRIEVVPEPLYSWTESRNGSRMVSSAVDDRRRILSIYAGQKVEIFERLIESLGPFHQERTRQRHALFDRLETRARGIAETLSASYEPNSESAFKELALYLVERQKIDEALDFALCNGTSLLTEVAALSGQLAEANALDAVRRNPLEFYCEIDLSRDIRDRICSAAIFPAEKLVTSDTVVAVHSLGPGLRVLKAAAVCPPGARSIHLKVKVESSDDRATFLAAVISPPHARMKYSGQVLTSKDSFWWSDWTEVSSDDEYVEIAVILPSTVRELLDLHLLCRADSLAVSEDARVIWKSATAKLVVNGAFTESSIEAGIAESPIPLHVVERGSVVTKNPEFSFPIFSPGDKTLLHPLPKRAAIVRIPAAIPAGTIGLKSVVSLERNESHPVQFAICIRSADAPANSEEDFVGDEGFSGWYPVTDKFRRHSFVVKLKERARKPMDLYLATRVVDFPDVHFCHAVWHRLLLLEEQQSGLYAESDSR